MAAPEDEVWLPLVDEPIGAVVAEVEAEQADIARLVASPRRILAFRTFAYLRVGMLLGELLVDHEPADRAAWVEELLRDPENRRRVVEEVRAVAEEIAADPRYADEEPFGPDEGARERFREFARRQRESRA